MPHLHTQSVVFVYGTLKEGFANFHVNAGRRIAGEFETVERFPLFILGKYYIPWLVQQPGKGEHVLGQLFNIDAAGLAKLDKLEREGEPGWFVRRKVLVRRYEAPMSGQRSALVYFGAAARIHVDIVHAGPLKEFNSTHDAQYRRAV